MHKQVGQAITANLGTKAKLDLFWALAHLNHGQTFIKDMAGLDKLVAETSNATGDIRTMVIHGGAELLGVTEDGADSDAIEIWAKWSARKGGIKGKIFMFTAGHFNAHTATIRALVERWHQLRQDLKEEVEFLHFSERE